MAEKKTNIVLMFLNIINMNMIIVTLEIMILVNKSINEPIDNFNNKFK